MIGMKATPLLGRGARLLRVLTVGLSLAFALSGCGGCGEEEDKCEGVVCEQGVCSASTGVCINPESCGADSPACLEGYSCGDEARCVADFPCSEGGMCAQGECRTGACVNRDVCQSDDDCVADSFCDVATSACVPNPCTNGEVSCARGVCERASASCVNEVICTTQNEDTACLEGFRCSGQACISEQAFCDSLACTRGECSFEAGACVDAASCDSDMDCLAGRYCADDSTCQVNACDATMTECARGVCEASSGECVNPASCNASAQCVDGNLCVGDACVPELQACGADGCPGNQVCNYDALTRTAQCGEAANGACTSALDCVDERICRSGACQAPVACEADALEPNDTAAEATDYFAVRASTGVSASICAGDVDLFAFNTTQSASTIGRLSVTLDILPIDRGLGALKLELLDRSGTAAGQATTDAQGRAQVSLDVSIAAQGVYTVRVSGEGDLNSTGVRYNVFATILDSTVIQACQSPRALVPGMSVNSSTTSGGSTALAMSCADANGAVAEDIYAITVAQRGYVSVTVTPDTDVDLGVSLRSDCLSDGSELRNACANRAGVAGEEVVSALVEPGTYFAVVQADTAAASGFYDISMAIEPAICTASDNTCINANTARECNARGTEFNDISCDNGCNAATGSCNRPLGDVCTQPRIIALGNQETIEVDWSALRADYDPGPSGCVPTSASGSATDGPDLSLEIEVPAQTSLIATLSDTGNDVAMYLVESCADLANTCLVAANVSASSNEELSWANESMQPVTVRLIADITQADAYIASTLTLEGKSIICSPDAISCGTSADGDVISQTCDSTGTTYASTRNCLFGCDAMTGLCNTPLNDKCGGALTLTSGVPLQAELGDYSVDYNRPSNFCPDHQWSVSGRDAIFKVSAQAGDVIKATLTTANPTFDSSLWVTSSCDAMEQLGVCEIGSDRAGQVPETLTFVASTAGDYYIVAAAFSATAMGGFTIEATVQTPSCTPGEQLGCSADGMSVEICGDLGVPETTPCSFGCMNDACVVPQGERCADPIVLTSGVAAQADLSLFTIDHTRPSGSCPNTGSGSSNGKDVVFSIAAQAGDIVDVVMTPSPSFDAVLTIANSCDAVAGTLGACLAGRDGGNPETLRFVAPTTGDYFIVAAAFSASATGGPFTIEATVQSPTCTPNTVFGCSADGMSVDVCNQLGLPESVSCANGCANDACIVPEGERCQNPIVLTSGVATQADLSTFAIDYTRASGVCPNTGSGSSNGKDMVFMISAQAGDILDVELNASPSFDSAITIVNQCNQATGAIGACLAGRDTTSNPEQLTFIVPTTGDYFIIASAFSSSATGGPFTITATLTTPSCTPGARLGCSADGQSIEYCGDFGTPETLSCGVGGCVNGLCATPQGRTCYDALQLTGQGGTETGGWTGTNDLALQANRAYGQCLIPSGAASIGFDTFYQIALQAGELFEASLVTTTSSAYLMLFEDCADPDSCVANNPRRGATTLRYYAEQPVTLTVVVDATSTFLTTTPYTLNWNVSTGLNCAPGQTRCVDATTMAVCDADGLTVTQVVCDGVCTGRGCQLDPVTSNSCAAVLADPSDIGDGVTLYGNLSQLTNTLNFTAANSCAGGLSTPGPDTFQKVVLNDGEVLEVRAEVFGATRPLIYIINDCSATAASCVAGVAGSTTTYTGRAFYLNDTGAPETLLVGLDTNSSTSTGFFALSIGKRLPECTPGARQCDVMGQDAQLCNSAGLFERTSCAMGCMNGRCILPPGDVCSDAIALSPGVPVQGDLTAYGVNHARPSSSCPNTGSGLSNGKDVVYKVNALAGDIIDITLASSFDSVITITDSCDTTTDTAGACLAGRDSGQPERLTYTAPADGEYFIIASAYSSATSTGTFTLTVNVDTPTCTPNMVLGCSADGMNLERCDAFGVVRTTLCGDNGCANSACLPPTGDVCSDAIALTPGVPTTVNMTPFNIDHAQTFAQSCTGSTQAGKDAVFSVFAQAGDIVTVTLSNATTSFTANLWVADSCDLATSALGACVVGTNTGTPRTVSFSAPVAGEYFVVASLTSATAAGGPLVVEATVEPPECVASTVLGCLPDGTTLEVCDDLGLVEQITCAQGCMNDACVLPDGEQCTNAIPLTSGVPYSGATAGYASNYPLTNAQSCTAFSFTGVDTVFSIMATAGQSLVVNFTASFDGAIWLSDTCSPTAQLSACLVGSDVTGTTENFTYTIPADGEYFLVTGPWISSSAGGTYTVTATLQ